MPTDEVIKELREEMLDFNDDELNPEVEGELTEGEEIAENGTQPTEDEISEEAEGEGQEEVEEEVEEGPEDEGESVEEPESEPELEDEDESANLVALLNKQAAEIAELRRKIPAEDKEESEAPKKQATPIETSDYIGDLDIDEVVADPELFNEVLNKVAANSAEAAARQVLLAIPNVVSQQVNWVTTLGKETDAFWAANEDLKPVSNIVEMAIERIATEHPDYEFSKIFKEAGEETRKVLKMSKEKLSDGRTVSTSALPTKTASKKKIEDARSKLQRDLDDMRPDNII